MLSTSTVGGQQGLLKKHWMGGVFKYSSIPNEGIGSGALKLRRVVDLGSMSWVVICRMYSIQ